MGLGKTRPRRNGVANKGGAAERGPERSEDRKCPLRFVAAVLGSQDQQRVARVATLDTHLRILLNRFTLTADFRVIVSCASLRLGPGDVVTAEHVYDRGAAAARRS